ncbi:MAG: PLDc_N domain-containing protein [Saccharothrix sp.]|nr:PLDc_N domain-containing protein [Saccharothrix sp.]
MPSTTPFAAAGPLAQEQDLPGVEIAVLAVLGVAALAALVLWITAIVSVLRNRRLTGGGKLLWIAVVLAYPLLGSIGWFAGGRTARLVNDPGPTVPFVR